MINISVKGFKLSDGTVEKYDYSSLEDIVTDTTLALSGVAADAKKVGDEISDIKEDLSQLEEYEIYVDGTTLVINTNLVNGNEVSY